jgi:hypothetical protein
MGMRAVKALAAICIGALSACAAGQPALVSLPPAAAPLAAAPPVGSPPVGSPPVGSPPAPGGMPGYYVVVSGLKVVVRASADGHVTGSVTLPVAASTGRTVVGGEPFGSPDGRNFLIVVSRGGDLPGVSDDTLFRLAVSPDGRPGKLSQIGFDSRGVPVIGAALSPDGKMVALSLVNEFPPGTLYGSVDVIYLASGAIRTWADPSAAGYWPGAPAWASDSTVVVPWWHDTGHGMIPAEITGVRQLDLAAPGGSLAGTRLAAFSAPVPDLESAVLAPGGGQLITSSCRTGHHTASVQVAELSAVDGQLVRALRTQTAQFRNDADAQDAVFSECQVLSVAGDGNQVLVQAFGFGRIDNGAFTSLSGITPRDLQVLAAW